MDKEDFKNDVSREIGNIAMKMADEFKEAYANALSTLLKQVKDEFSLNIDKYSLKMQALIEDKKAMEELRSKIELAEQALKSCQKELDSTIWSVNDNAQ